MLGRRTAGQDHEVLTVAQPEPTTSAQQIPDDPRWSDVRRGLDQMFQGAVIVLLGVGLQLLLGDVPTRSRQASMIAWGLIGLVVVGGGIFYLIGCFRCLAAPRPHRDWMVGYLTAIGALVLVVGALLTWLFSGAPIKPGSLGPVGISLFGAAVVATIAFITCLPFFISSISRAFGNESFASLCRFFCGIQLLWYVVQVGLIVSARLEANNPGPKDVLNFETDPGMREAMKLASWVIEYGSALWHAVMLYQAQQMLARGPVKGAGAPEGK
jgi:hypothetical protein